MAHLIRHGKVPGAVWNRAFLDSPVSLYFFHFCDHSVDDHNGINAQEWERYIGGRESGHHFESTGQWMQKAWFGRQPRRVDARGITEETILVQKCKDVILQRGIERWKKDDVAVECMRSISQLGPYAVSNIFNICKRGTYIHKDLFELMAEWVLRYEKEMISRFTTFEIAMTIQSLGLLFRMDFSKSTDAQKRKKLLAIEVWDSKRKARRTRVVKPDPVPHGDVFFKNCQNLVEALLVEFMERDGNGTLECDERGMADLLHGLGCLYREYNGMKINTKVTNVVDTILEVVTQPDSVILCKPHDFANLMYGCGSMQHGNKDHLNLIMDDIVRRLANVESREEADDRLEDDLVTSFTQRRDMYRVSSTNTFSGFCVGNILWGMGKLGVDHQQALDALGSKAVDIAPDMEDSHIASAIHGLALLEHKNDVVLDALSREVAVPVRLYNFREREIANIVYSFGRLRYLNRPVMRALCTEIQRENRIEKYDEEEIKNMVYGFARLNYLDDRTLGEVCKAALRLQRSLSLQGLMTIIHGFAELGYENDPIIDALTKEVCKQAKIVPLPEPTLANFIYSLGRMRWRHKGMFESLANEVGRRIHKGAFTPEDYAKIYFGLGRVIYENDDLYDALGNAITKKDILSKFSPEGLCNVVYGFVQVHYQNQDVIGAIKKEVGSRDDVSPEQLAFINKGFSKLEKKKKMVKIIIPAPPMSRHDPRNEVASG